MAKRHFAELDRKSGLSFTLLVFFSIIFLGTLIYSNSFNARFQFDDDISIAKQVAVGSYRNIGTVWDSSQTRFLTYLSFFLNYRFGEFNVFGYHLVNFLIHILNSLLVCRFVLLIFRAPKMLGNSLNQHARTLSIFSALFFLCHPIQTQAVTYLSQRAASLATLFYLGSVVLYLQARLKGGIVRYFFALLTTAASMLAKEISFTLPLALFLCEITFFGVEKQSLRKRFFYFLPFLSTILIIPIIQIRSTGPAIWENIDELAAQTTQISRTDYLLTQFNVIRTYLRLLFLPIHQNLDYDYPITNSIFDLKTFFSFLLLVGIFAFAVMVRRRWKLISFGLFWFFLTLSVESSIIPIADVIFEHRLYLPMVGFSIFIASAFIHCFSNKNARLVLFLTVIGIFSVMTYRRNFIWKDRYTLWQDVVRKSPGKARAHGNLATLFARQGKYEEAFREYTEELKITPNDPSALINFGFVLERQGKMEEAMQNFSKALEINPNRSWEHYVMGLALQKRNKIEEAIPQFLEAIRLKPAAVDPRHALALILVSQGKFEEAISQYQEVLKIDPKFKAAYNNLGGISFKQGKYQDAIKYYIEGLKVDPGNSEMRKNLQVVQQKLKSLRQPPQT